MTLLIKKWKEKDDELDKSDLLKRIDAVESMAYIHGASEYKGVTLKEWIKQDRIATIEVIEEHIRSSKHEFSGIGDEICKKAEILGHKLLQISLLSSLKDSKTIKNQ